MNPLTWTPPAAAWVVFGVILVALWLFASPPRRDEGVRAALRFAAAFLLLASLLGVGIRGSIDDRGALVVLLDRSVSMEVAGPEGSRAGFAREWLESPPFRDWTSGWSVTIDSFGGRTTDIQGAIERVSSGFPDAIVVVSDGRAVGGRSAEAPPVPMFASVPEPVTVPDLAITGLWLSGGIATVEIAASGGEATPDGGVLTLRVGGDVVDTRVIPRLDGGERVELRVPIGPRRSVELVEASIESPGDVVPGNDRRLALVRPEDDQRRTLVVGLRPGWDMAPFLRRLREIESGPIDAYLAAGPSLRPIEPDTGPTTWASLPRARFGVVYLFGDPDALDDRGRAWVEALAASGGVGLFWAPGTGSGPLPGVSITVQDGPRVSDRPRLTEAGRAWLLARGIRPNRAPDGSEVWPLVEQIPAGRTAGEPSGTILLEAGDQPIAWVRERGTTRTATVLGVGYYRWAVSGGGAGDVEARAFWSLWVEAIARWLAAATPGERLGVRMPEGRRVERGGRLEAGIAAASQTSVTWEVRRSDQGNGEDVAVRGRIEEGSAPRSIVAGPFEPGLYLLRAESADGAWSVEEPFVVDALAPDLATTAADSTGLASAARSSGGALLGRGDLPPLPEPEEAAGGGAGRVASAATSPWPLLIAVMLLLTDWGLALASRRGGG